MMTQLASWASCDSQFLTSQQFTTREWEKPSEEGFSLNLSSSGCLEARPGVEPG